MNGDNLETISFIFIFKKICISCEPDYIGEVCLKKSFITRLGLGMPDLGPGNPFSLGDVVDNSASGGCG
jgi:hypothetical protein